ncbi:MAG: ribulose-phosphate 3-epimerase [Sulfuricurvum sp. 24-42-5]|nr:MAG: ribulose-phosphate 3-epimerase [Sulfuricurvum sp. 24-42-5]
MVKAIRPHASIPFDVHLMISPADPYLEAFRAAGADIISIHPEAGPHLHRSLKRIRELGAKAGVVFNPSTSIDHVEWILEDVDLLLVMSVNPGFGGQKFIPTVVEKIKRLKVLRDRINPECLIEIDGGVGSSNIQLLKDAGVDICVAGSYVFGADDYKTAIDSLRV